jgi:putative ATPase
LARLTERLRPRTLEEIVGQSHLIDPGRPLGDAIRRGRVHNLVAWGPPGTGKSALAEIVAGRAVDDRIPEVPGRPSRKGYERLSGAAIGLRELRRAARRESTVMVIDEIHLLTPRVQEDVVYLLDRGAQILATTSLEPSLALIPALLSRLAAYRFHPLPPEALDLLVARAFGPETLALEPAAREYLVEWARGDARRLLDALDRLLLAESGTAETAMAVTAPDLSVYPSGGSGHYDVVTAFVKSVRGSDVDAALYWLAAMLTAGEDVRFIARRLCVCAAEDVGLADAFALVLASTVLQALEGMDLGEARMLLAHATSYLAAAPKSGAAARGLERAETEVRSRGTQPVPLHLRQRSLRGTPEAGYSQGAPFRSPKSAFLFPQYLPDALVRETFFEPGQSGAEARVRERLRAWWPDRYA